MAWDFDGILEVGEGWVIYTSIVCVYVKRDCGLLWVEDKESCGNIYGYLMIEIIDGYKQYSAST